jgi:hypothetical protein
MQQKRRLISIPIIHTRADFGSLGSKVPFDQEVEGMKTEYWNEIFDYVRNLPVDFSKLKVYQDGLPDTSVEIVAKIVDETQTPNYEVLHWLRDQKAHIMGTESPTLLLEEYRSLQAIFNAPSEELKRAALLEYREKSEFLLEGRDRYVARRINETLSEGEEGLLFVGLAHDIKKLLEKEMEVIEPESLIGASPEALRNKLYGKEGVR